MLVKEFFDEATATFSYIIVDSSTSKCAIIDPVLDFDIFSGTISTKSADHLISYINEEKLVLEWILETHAHADHLTSASYIKSKLGGQIGIGARIKEVIDYWAPIFNTPESYLSCNQFDHLFEDNEIFNIGSIEVKVFFTPGHTPACSSYYMEDSVFVGDTILMPHLGTARTDFPGASAGTLYDSITKLLSLPDNTKVYVCHDYPPEGETLKSHCTVADQKKHNKFFSKNISREEYISTRNKMDEGKPVPKLLLPSIQINIMAGKIDIKEDNGREYIKIPLTISHI
jgi:glyoxylase-like metal-dependent hydrolase (beta-lactamase superfamily II)